MLDNITISSRQVTSSNTPFKGKPQRQSKQIIIPSKPLKVQPTPTKSSKTPTKDSEPPAKTPPLGSVVGSPIETETVKEETSCQNLDLSFGSAALQETFKKHQKAYDATLKIEIISIKFGKV